MHFNHKFFFFKYFFLFCSNVRKHKGTWRNQLSNNITFSVFSQCICLFIAVKRIAVHHILHSFHCRLYSTRLDTRLHSIKYLFVCWISEDSCAWKYVAFIRSLGSNERNTSRIATDHNNSPFWCDLIERLTLNSKITLCRFNMPILTKFS